LTPGPPTRRAGQGLPTGNGQLSSTRIGAHLAIAAGDQDLLIAIFLAGGRFGSGTRISSTPAL